MTTSIRAPRIRVAVTKLRMDALTTDQLNEYIDSGQWEGKAGASATRIGSVGFTLSKGASRMSSDYRWNC